MKTLPHGYKERALFPDSVFGEMKTRDYVTKDGVNVRITFRGVFDNRDGGSRDILERVCMKIYGAPYKAVERRWSLNYRIDGWWHLVEMKRK